MNQNDADASLIVFKQSVGVDYMFSPLPSKNKSTYEIRIMYKQKQYLVTAIFSIIHIYTK